jgi:hypothetical protein
MMSSVGLFYLSLLTFQRLAGVLLHAGHPLPLVATAGFGMVSLSSGISQALAPVVAAELLDHHRLKLVPEDFARSSLLTVASFAALERNFFQTALPSSIITRGVYARRGGAVVATSEVATKVQRKWIQRMGKLHGCHHCGYRPLLNLQGRVKYIADHMPPTNRVHMEGKKMWRKMFKMTNIKQMLYPQCGKCCSIQASAARDLAHKPIFHFALRSWHFAPALALFLASQEEVREAARPAVKYVVRALDPAVVSVVDFVNDAFR